MEKRPLNECSSSSFVSWKGICSRMICSCCREALWSACRSSLCREVCGVDGDGGIQFDVDAAQQ